jgi:hypothetical protein
MWWGGEAYRPKATAFILPAVFISAGVAVTAWGKGTNDFGLTRRRWEPMNQSASVYADYAEYGMFGWVFLCDFMGKERHQWQEQVMLTILAEMINGTLVSGLKYTINLPRPNGGKQSFPSGHTANAFLGAHLTFKEFRKSSPWLACSGYLMATAVAASRVYYHKHWIADVVAGAGIGMLSVELAYLLYFPRHKAVPSSGKVWASPILLDKGGGLHISYSF